MRRSKAKQASKVSKTEVRQGRDGCDGSGAFEGQESEMEVVNNNSKPLSSSFFTTTHYTPNSLRTSTRCLVGAP